MVVPVDKQMLTSNKTFELLLYTAFNFEINITKRCSLLTVNQSHSDRAQKISHFSKVTGTMSIIEKSGVSLRISRQLYFGISVTRVSACVRSCSSHACTH